MTAHVGWEVQKNSADWVLDQSLAVMSLLLSEMRTGEGGERREAGEAAGRGTLKYLSSPHTHNFAP